MMCIGMFMAILDVQVVATSLPTIQKSLGILPSQMSWVQTAYLIAEVIAIPLTGLLTRALTMRWLFVCAVGIFTLASIGCASSVDFASLIGWRILQGLAGGALIPSVFSAVFILFPSKQQTIATTIAGLLAVFAPTAGPIVGGWITQTFSWHWLFLINVAPGVIAAVFACMTLPKDKPATLVIRTLDTIALLSLALSLALLEIGLKEAPDRGWLSPFVIGLFGISLLSALLFVRRSLARNAPIVDLRNFRDLRFTIGCALSFALGFGLFGSVYLMPLFLAFVRDHNALEIGVIMLVTGIAQLTTAPIAVALEQRVGARLLTASGFAVFAVGLLMSAFQTPASDYDALFWPQIVRGLAIMFCLLPPTRLALGALAPEKVPDASGLFNLMRNLGGAIGLALIDTVIYSRAPHHGAVLIEKLQMGDTTAAEFVGVPVALLPKAGDVPDASAQALLQPLIDKAALTMGINDAWLMLAIVTSIVMLFIPFAKGRTAQKI